MTVSAPSRGVGVAVTCEARDPVAMFFGDPNSHLSDVLYLYFRHNKRQRIYGFVKQAIDATGLGASDTLAVADVGASMGFDLKYVFSRLGQERTGRPRSTKTTINLVEGDDDLIRAGEVEWSRFAAETGLSCRYVKSDLAQALPLPESSQDIIVCSEVVEHLENPVALLCEMHRALKPTCPSLLQQIRRVPVWLAGRYRTSYARPDKNTEIASHVVLGGITRPIYGHINLNSTRIGKGLPPRPVSSWRRSAPTNRFGGAAVGNRRARWRCTLASGSWFHCCREGSAVSSVTRQR
jgi:SAM-dependent methyltransferase